MLSMCGNACTLEQLQPVFRLITFLERDLELGDEVCLSVRITRLTNVGPDGGRRAFELIHEGAVAVYGFGRAAASVRQNPWTGR